MIDWLTKTRKIDHLGRVVIPTNTLKYLNIKPNDHLTFYIDQEQIILQKYDPSMKRCIFCGKVENLITIKNKLVCQTCFQELIDYAAWSEGL